MDIDAAINALKKKIGKSTYSMEGSRDFSDGTCDCSGAVYYGLRKAGCSDFAYITSTETLHEYLVQNGITLKAENEPFNMEKGDIIIWGKQGQSAGANGHTGICIDNQNWIECTAWHDLGETIQNHDKRWVMAGKPFFYVYHYTGRTPGINPNVTYGLHVKGGDWLSPVVNFNPVNSDGYAGLPNHEHDMLYARVDHGALKYRVHTIEAGWLDWVTSGNPNDPVNGCAGMFGQTIDGVQMVYLTPSGEYYRNAYYRSQTTKRADWLPEVADDSDFAGIFGEPLDRLQAAVNIRDPFGEQ